MLVKRSAVLSAGMIAYTPIGYGVVSRVIDSGFGVVVSLYSGRTVSFSNYSNIPVLAVTKGRKQ